jgi:ATP-dependent RNA helicase RhlE
MIFKSLGLSSPLLKAIQDSGYAEPTPVQKKAIPMILNGSDMVVSARTGTGKTAGFTLPILELLYTRKSSRENGVKALIICPTRELADQIYKSTKLYGKYLNIRTTVVYGG